MNRPYLSLQCFAAILSCIWQSNFSSLFHSDAFTCVNLYDCIHSVFRLSISQYWRFVATVASTFLSAVFKLSCDFVWLPYKILLSVEWREYQNWFLYPLLWGLDDRIFLLIPHFNNKVRFIRPSLNSAIPLESEKSPTECSSWYVHSTLVRSKKKNLNTYISGLYIVHGQAHFTLCWVFSLSSVECFCRIFSLNFFHSSQWCRERVRKCELGMCNKTAHAAIATCTSTGTK